MSALCPEHPAAEPGIGFGLAGGGYGPYSFCPLCSRILDKWPERESEKPSAVDALKINALFDAYESLRIAGWQEIAYAPKDGTEIEVIELGSTGIHRARWLSFKHEPLDTCGAFFIDGDAPSHPVLFRPLP